MKIPVSCLLIFGLLVCIASHSARAEDQKKKKYEFKIETVKAQPVMSIRFKVPADHDKITAKYSEVFGAVFTHVLSNGAQPAGAPFGRYHSVKDVELDIEAGIPVAKLIAGKGDIKAAKLPAGKVITTIHHGPYSKLAEAHDALQKWVKAKGHKVTGPPWESYVTDPGTEKDESKWQTKLFIPIAEKNKGKSK